MFSIVDAVVTLGLVAGMGVVATSAAETSRPAVGVGVVAERSEKSRPRLLVSERVGPARATVVRSADGVQLRVPKHTASRRGHASISRVRRGIYDIDISVPFEGRVKVTMPLTNAPRDAVLHKVGDTWVLEGDKYGQKSVWIERLSRFSWSEAKAAKAFCATWIIDEILRCLVNRGIKYVEPDLARWIGSEINSSCWAALVAGGLTGGRYGVLTAAFFSVSCINAPPPSPPPGVRQVMTIGHSLRGTWARTDPNDGTWHAVSDAPDNAAYWYANGLGVGVDCARTAAAYTVTFPNGATQVWRTWFHVTDGKWFPSAAALQTEADGFYGLPACYP